MNTGFLPTTWIVLLLVTACATFAQEAGGPAFAPTVENKTPAPSPAPKGMVWIPDGEFLHGQRWKV
jgi:hypothetical protein